MLRDFPLRANPMLAAQLSDAGRIVVPDPPVPTRPAATVIVVRDGTAGPEVFMLHRAASMAFAPSVHVFPGGGVDARDDRADLPWAGPSAADWARRLDTDERSARMLVTAAVREVFEEIGVLLAGPVGGADVIADVADSFWQGARAAVEARRIGFADLLAEHGLALHTGLLRYRAHWTTPTFEKRRYDTRFFAAALPAGQTADATATREAQASGWARPADLLAAYHHGTAALMPPTQVCLEDVAQAATVADYLAGAPPTREILPALVQTPDGLVIRADLP